MSAEKRVIKGNPNPEKISTSSIERQNLTMRRFTRLTNGFSKKIENTARAMALHFMHYNFARIHKTLRVTHAMAADVSDHVWSLEESPRLRREKLNATRHAYNSLGPSPTARFRRTGIVYTMHSHEKPQDF